MSMANHINRPKTPTLAVARVMRSYGLKQGTDFRVSGQYGPRVGGYPAERIGTFVLPISRKAEDTISENADRIEELSVESGWPFRVSVYRPAGRRVWTKVANFGKRVREQAPSPVAEAAPVAETPEAKPAAKTLPGVTLKLGAPRPAFGQHAEQVEPLTPYAHPYDGLPQKTYGALTWACQEAGATWFFQDTAKGPRYELRVYRGRVGVHGWYLTGPGVHSSGLWMGRTISEAAEASEDTILTHMEVIRNAERVGADWPEGTRVRGIDSNGRARTGTVNGRDVGAVVLAGHDNYGRTFIGVDWDSAPGKVPPIRARPFTDRLTRI